MVCFCPIFGHRDGGFANGFDYGFLLKTKTCKRSLISLIKNNNKMKVRGTNIVYRLAKRTANLGLHWFKFSLKIKKSQRLVGKNK